MAHKLFLAVALFSAYSLQSMAAADIMSTSTCDFVTTPTQFAFIQSMNEDLHYFMNALAADRQLYQAWNMTLAQLISTLTMYEQQHTNAINQARVTVYQLKDMLAHQERQGQEYAATITTLSEQLSVLQQQTDQEIIALQQQLDDTTLELDMLEDEYGDFIDASFAHAQAFYNMLQMAKEEYAQLIGERTQFFNALQHLTDALHNHSQGMTSEVYDLIEGFDDSSYQTAS